MDDATLLKALTEHKKRCFHKNVCDICHVDGYDDNFQCDYCGNLYNMQDYTVYEYECKCGKCPDLHICEKCDETNITHYEFIEEYSDETFDEYIAGKYVNDCCPITKQAK